MPGGIRTHDPSIIDKAMWQSWVKRCHSRPNRTSLSGAMSKFTKTRGTSSGTCKGGATVAYPMAHAHTWCISDHKVWAESVHWFGLQCCTFLWNLLQDCTWHPPRATDWSTTSTIVFLPLRRIKWIFAADRTSRSGSRGWAGSDGVWATTERER